MFRKIITLMLALFAAAAFAAVDANKADQAALETVKGIGPAISGKIVDERKKGAFKDWPDLVERVSGIGETNAAKFSAEGLTVNGASYKGAAPAAKKDDKPAAKAEAKPAAKTEAKSEPKADAKAAKPAADKKAEPAAPAKPAAEPAKSEKAAKPAKSASAPASAAKK